MLVYFQRKALFYYEKVVNPLATYGSINPSNFATGSAQESNNIPIIPKPKPPKFVAGTQVDLGTMKAAVQDYKPGEAQFSTGDLKTTMDGAAQNGQTVDTQYLKTALGAKPADTFTNSQLQGLMNNQGSVGKANNFSLDQLQSSIGNAQTAATPVAVQAAKYQDPAQFQALLTQMNQVLAPLTQMQKGAAQSAYGEQSSALADKWAANGLLASGGAMAQQQQGANVLASQMAAIEAQQQANAVPLAQNFAQLGLSEDAQKFQQNANNRDFTAQQAQNNVGNVLSGLGAQMNQNQFDFSKSQTGIQNQLAALAQQGQQQQNWMQNAQNIAGMDIGQNQWSQQFGQQVKQADVNNQLAGLGFEANQQQNYLNNMKDVTNMDVNQNKWAQDFGLQRQQSEMGNDLNWAQLQNNQTQFNSSQNQASDQFLANLAARQNEFNTNTQLDRDKMTQQQGQFDRIQGSADKQANWNAYLQSVGLTGNTGTGPKLDWGNLGDNGGQTTAPQQNQIMDFLSKLMQYSPYAPKGMGDVAAQNPAYSGMQDILNKMGGTPSQSTHNNDSQLDLEKSKAGAEMGYKWATYAMDKDYKQYLMNQGISETDAKDNTNAMIADLMSAPNEAAAQAFLSDPETVNRARSGGVNMKAVQDVMSDKFKKPTSSAASNGDNTKLLNDAYDNANKVLQDDIGYIKADAATKQQMVEKFAKDYMAKHQSSYSGN